MDDGARESIDNILLLGEANFSFTLAYLQKHENRHSNVIGTSYETYDMCLKKYGPLTKKNIDQIIELEGNVYHSVDATNLNETLFPQLNKNIYFQEIIFNFPHIGRKASIALNRKLLKDFFTSASKHLARNGSITVSLSAGQGGTPSDSVQREHCNSWQIVEMAAYSGLALIEVYPFTDVTGYKSSGKRNHAASFITNGAMSYVFKKTDKPTCLQSDWNVDLNIWKSSLVEERVKIIKYKNLALLPQCWLAQQFEKLTQEKNLQYIQTPPANILNNLNNLCNSATKNCINWTHGFSSSVQNNVALTRWSPIQYTLIFLIDISSLDAAEVFLKFFKAVKRNYGSSELNIDIVKAENECEVDIRNITITKIVNVHGTGQILAWFGILQIETSIYKLCIVNMDNLLYLLQPSMTSQILWTLNADTRQSVIQSLEQKKAFKCVVLHSSTYTHDFSFWVKSDSYVEEKTIKTLLLQTSDYRIVSIKLKDRYTKKDRTSFCFTVEYRSEDCATSKQDSNLMQENFRDKLQKLLKVELR